MNELQKTHDTVIDHVRESLSANAGKVSAALLKAPALTTDNGNPQKSLAEAYKEALRFNFRTYASDYEALTKPSAQSLALGAEAVYRPDMTFAQYMQHAVGIAPGEGKASLSALKPLYTALGINTAVASMDELANSAKLASSGQYNTGVADENLRFLVLESFTQAIRTGISTQAIWNRLISRTITVPNNMVNVPIIKAPYAVMQKMGEKVSVGEGNWDYSIKKLTTDKYGFAVSLTDEIRQYIAFDLLADTMAELGRATDASMNVQAIFTLINGDTSQTPAPAVSVGVATTGTLVYTDLLRLTAEAAKHALEFSVVLCNTDEYIRLTQLPEVRGYSGETKQLVLNQANIPSLNSMTIVSDPNIPAGKYLMVDPRKALVRVNENTGLSVETERVSAKELNVYYARTRGTWYREITQAAVLLDTTLAYQASQTNWGANALLTQDFARGL